MDDESLIIFTMLPSDRDAALAARASAKLAALAASDEPVPARFGAADAEPVELPAAVILLLRDILDHMGRGKAVAMALVHDELNAQQAADILNVSKAYRVLDHARFLAFRDHTDEPRRKDALNELTAYDQELGLQ